MSDLDPLAGLSLDELDAVALLAYANVEGVEITRHDPPDVPHARHGSNTDEQMARARGYSRDD